MVPAWSKGSSQGWAGPGVGVARVGVAQLAAYSPIILFDLHKHFVEASSLDCRGN